MQGGKRQSKQKRPRARHSDTEKTHINGAAEPQSRKRHKTLGNTRHGRSSRTTKQ